MDCMPSPCIFTFKTIMKSTSHFTISLLCASLSRTSYDSSKLNKFFIKWSMVNSASGCTVDLKTLLSVQFAVDRVFFSRESAVMLENTCIEVEIPL